VRGSGKGRISVGQDRGRKRGGVKVGEQEERKKDFALVDEGKRGGGLRASDEQKTGTRERKSKKRSEGREEGRRLGGKVCSKRWMTWATT
jgi:hypothetical protein